MKKDAAGAIAHLTKSIEIYPNFVAAHNALGTAYLNQGDSQQALEQFHRAIALDDHLPNSYLNLGCAQIARKEFADAEGSLKKAAAIAPLDLPLLTALTYAEFANQDYPAVVTGVKQIHGRKHDGAAVVHYFAAGALEAQGIWPVHGARWRRRWRRRRSRRRQASGGGCCSRLRMRRRGG